MTGTVTKGLAQRGDLNQYDGTLAASRTDSTGGTVTGLKVNDYVDVLQTFGGGLTENMTKATIDTATTALGSTNIALMFAPGSWVLDDDKTLASNFTVICPAGCTFEPASGKTLTIAGVFFRQHATYSGGAGTVTISGTDILEAQATTSHYAADTGAADAYVMTPSPVVASYAAGQQYAFLATNANTGSSTLNVSALGAKTVQKYTNAGALTDLVSGDILASQIITVRYDGTQFQMIPNIQETSGDAGTFSTITTTGAITSGGDISSDTDSTDDLGTTGVRWANLYVDDVTVTTSIDTPSVGVAGQQLLVPASSIRAANQPAFMATNLALANKTGNGASYTVVFATVVYDQATNFPDPFTTFTAPVAGRYLLTAIIQSSGMTGQTADQYVMQLVTSNRTYEYLDNLTDGTGTNKSTTLAVVADMDASDTAHVVLAVSGEASDLVDIGTADAFFSGCMLA